MNDRDRPEISLTWMRRAAAGERTAERTLIETLMPVIRASVARTMARRRASVGREVRQEVDDVTQSVLLMLFAKEGGQALSRWDPTRGLDVQSFVSLLASHEASSILRNRRRSPWTEEQPTQTETLDDTPASVAGPESLAGSRSMVAAVAARVEEQVSPRGKRMFELLFLEGHPPQEVSALTGMALPAVYAWRSRLSRLLREAGTELSSEPARPAEGGPLPSPPARGAGATALRARRRGAKKSVLGAC